MSYRFRRLAAVGWLAVLFLPSPRPVHAMGVTTIGDGGDLVAAVAAAAHGDVIEIHSNETFVGTLSWTDKFLTLQAGEGFHPTIKGNPWVTEPALPIGLPALAAVDGVPGSGGSFRGIRFEAGALPPRNPAFDSLPIVFLSVYATPFEKTNSDVTFQKCQFPGLVNYIGANYTLNLTAQDNLFGRYLSVGGDGTSHADVALERNRFEGQGGFSFVGHKSGHADAINNVFVATEETVSRTGIQLHSTSRSAISGRFVNNTVIGFDVGVTVGAGVSATFENMLLMNDDDIEAFGRSTITYSVIADGSFPSGNFSGVPLLGPDQQLLFGSIGIDAGNNAAIGLPSTDLLGNPRILDGDGDGGPRVDVGAYEFVIPEPTRLGMTPLALLAISRAARSRPGRQSRQNVWRNALGRA
jgi:hypothetical protein